MASKKDYLAMAQIIRMVTTDEGMIDRDCLIAELSDYYERDNPNFDRDLFYKACYKKEG